MTWQPIETAPKDGGYILIGWDYSTHIGIARWDDDQFNRKPRPFWRITGSLSVTRDRANQLTHWMPLPEPPPAPDNRRVG